MNFLFFYLVHIAKYIRNNLIKRGNYSEYPYITLPDANLIPRGICDVKWVIELYKSTTSNLINDVNFPTKVMWLSNLEMQQVTPTFMLLKPQITVALRYMFGKLAEGTVFLEMIHKCVVLPVLRIFAIKAARKCNPRAATFHSSYEIRLKRAATITNWLSEWQLEVIKKTKM